MFIKMEVKVCCFAGFCLVFTDREHCASVWLTAKAIVISNAKLQHKTILNDKQKLCKGCESRWSGMSGINRASGYWSVTAVHFVLLI